MRRSLAPLLLLFGALASAAPPPQETPERAAELREIATRVETIRGLRFRREVPVHSVGRAAIGEYAARRVARFTTPAAIEAEERAARILGILPEGGSISTQYAQIVQDVAAGFYDPETKEYFLLDELPGGAGPVLAAHELTHALEDQHYDLDARLDAARGDDDRGFALMAVHEGSATLVMAAYAAQGLTKGWLAASDLQALAASDAARTDRLEEMPEALRRPLLGAYALGARFLMRGGAPGFGGTFPRDDADACYRSGPVSSEQILHPEKFWDAAQRDEPRSVAIPDAGPILGREWKVQGEGGLGELMLGLLVGARTPSVEDAFSSRPVDWTVEAAAGWGGDRWELWSRGASAVVLLQTVWDSERDAREFAAALPLRASFAARREGRTVSVAAGDLAAVPVKKLLKRMARSGL